MSGKENLIPLDKRTKEEQREIARKGGIASGKSRREKRDLKRAFIALLEEDFTDKQGRVISGAEAIAAKTFEQALKGNLRAFEIIRDTAGQKPVEEVRVENSEAQNKFAEVLEMWSSKKDEQ